jgi:hypothetical protein
VKVASKRLKSLQFSSSILEFPSYESRDFIGS